MSLRGSTPNKAEAISGLRSLSRGRRLLRPFGARNDGRGISRGLLAMTRPSFRKGLAFASLSGFLLALAYPRPNLWALAWVALIPLVNALERSKKWGEAFFTGLTGGIIFFLLSISWLRHVTVFGWLFVVVFQASYWGIFGVLNYQSRLLIKRRDLRILALAAFWVGLELLRTEVPVWGFGWNLLGASQASNLWMAQLASVGGVYSVSFLVLLGNLALYFRKTPKKRKEFPVPQIFFVLLGLVLLFGWHRIQQFNPRSLYRVSVVQGNIPQLLKWDSAYANKILRIYLNLTELISYDEPQLIIWPEAAYPGFFNREEAAEKVKSLVRKIQIPLLVGSPHQEDKGFYNSAYLLDSSGNVAERYDKIRLVPFGEYVPWKPVFGFLEPYAYALGVSDFSAGKEYTVFKVPLTLPSPPRGERERVRGLWPQFSVLICFEDTFPGLARSFAGRGADFLIVITNDAWFGDSSAPYQHLQASVFRALENGVSVVRAANTGVSGFVTPMGQVVARVKDKKGKDTWIMGGMTYPGVWAKKDTLYRSGGWLFPYVCLAVLIMMIFLPLTPTLSPRRGEGRVRGVFLLAFVVLSLVTLTGCIRLTAGGFHAKKGPGGETQVKEAYLDTDELVGKKPPGKIEVYE